MVQSQLFFMFIKNYDSSAMCFPGIDKLVNDGVVDRSIVPVTDHDDSSANLSAYRRVAYPSFKLAIRASVG